MKRAIYAVTASTLARLGLRQHRRADYVADVHEPRKVEDFIARGAGRAHRLSPRAYKIPESWFTPVQRESKV